MSSRNETLPATRPRSRKSIAHLPSAEHGGSMDKENMTADIGALVGSHKRATAGEKLNKKSRSKSIGPGGLDALKDGTGNRRQSGIAPVPRSILKPTMPPLREIPAHVASRNVSPRKPFPSSITTPTLNQNVLAKVQNNASVTGGADPPNDFALDGDAAAVETKVMLRTEEEQQIAAREREELERKAAEKDLNSRREARRKSLANRRVSFAPEATLHTWDVVEYMQDSTTSSASTDSTRRASSASSGITESPHSQTPRTPGSDASEPPSTPPEQDEDETVASPEHQRDLHQKKRRRSSAIPPLNFNNPDDETFSSSPYSELSVEDGEDADEGFITDDNNTSDSNSESDDEGTAMSLDMGDNTDMSMASVRSTASSTGSSARLEAALQQAARQAGTQGIDFDEHGETENPEEEEIVASFQPWSKKNLQPLSSLHDQENINPFPKALADVAAGLVDDEDDDDEGMTMDMTRAVGQILPAVQESDDEMTMDMTTAIGGIINKPREASSNTRRKSMPSGRRKSTRRRSSAEGSSFGDETMDLTMAIGGIQQFSANEQSAPDSAEDEDMTMEFTSVIGGVLAAGFPATRAQRRTSTKDSGPINTLRRDSIDSNNDTMDMTVAFGGIVPSILEASDSDGNVTVGMDMTLAIGRILPNQGDPAVRTHARRVMEEEVDSAEAVSSPFQTLVPSSAQKAVPAITMASETGSPSLVAIRGKALRRSGGPRVSSTPKSMVPETPIKTPSTPTKQITPNPSRPTTPAGKTPPSKNVTMRTSSPKKLFSDQLKPHTTTPKSTNSRRSATPNRLFNKDNATPSIVLTPKQRRSSGLGIDKTGLGSPRIAALLDRRVSIGESAMSFSPGQFDVTARGVRFDDPQVIEEILDKEREADKDQEDGRKILEREVDAGDEEKDATVNLKEMIQSLTPKKRQLKGRKSLHVGAARGILGKRPAELDEDEEEEQDGVKRLKNHQGSPVKNVRLQAPPTKSETTGRPPRLILEPLEATSNNITTPTAVSSPLKGVPVTTPRGQGRFKDVGSKSSAQKPPSYSDKAPLDEYTMNDEDNSEDNMRLQDFLNLTSIRFMELTTTKRRHTVAPGAFGEDGVGNIQNSQEIDNSLESCVVAGACTVPMLELFQHSCNELRKYISEGRRVVREIETETMEENPALFREYIYANPDVRMLMDNQFKNVKTHARLLSKAMWYEWRMKLLDGLKAGLDKTRDGLLNDEELLQQQQHLLDSVLPPLLSNFEHLSIEEADLQAAAADLANCDQEELDDARHRLVSLDADVESKKQVIRNLRAQMKENEIRMQKASTTKESYLDDIRASEKIREECRGWTGTEILALKAKVEALERDHGWTVTGVSGTVTSMSFRSELELVFDASSFKPNNCQKSITSPREDSRIDIWYIANTRDLNPLPFTAEKDFFLQNVREHCRSLPQSQTTIKELLNAVSVSWERAVKLTNQISALSLEYPTEVKKTSDTSIVVSSSLLLVPLETKVDFEFHLSTHSTQDGLNVVLAPQVVVIYGERFNEKKMTEVLASKAEGNVLESEDRLWSSAVLELEEKLLARARK